MERRRSGRRALVAAAAGITVAASGPAPVTHPSSPPEIHKIKHVIVIMQENRSFDSYFGTYPGADGIPMRDGQPAVCIPDSAAHGCVRPYHDRNDLNVGGPHAPVDAAADIAGGAMDGFVSQQRTARGGCEQTFNPGCGRSTGKPDVMGYHDGTDIPNYWTYARDLVL